MMSAAYSSACSLSLASLLAEALSTISCGGRRGREAKPNDSLD
jgi:hypothetical protein